MQPPRISTAETDARFAALTREQPFGLNHIGKKCLVATVRNLLELCEKTPGKARKKDIASVTLDYLTDTARHWFLAKHPPFLHVLLNKLHEYTFEPAFSEDEPRRWLRRLYVNTQIRRHMHCPVPGKDTTFVGMLGEPVEPKKCPCDAHNGPRRDDTVAEPGHCPACVCDHCKCTFGIDVARSCHCGAKVCTSCWAMTPGFQFERMEANRLQLIRCDQCDMRKAANAVRRATEIVATGDRHTYDAFRMTLPDPACIPSWYMARDYYAVDHTLGPYKHT